MAIQLKPGLKLRSVTDSCEVVVVKAPSDPVDLRCGGHPFVVADVAVPPKIVESAFVGPTQLGKRYGNDSLTLEILCTRAGEGAISIGEVILSVKGAKPLPASD